MDADTADPDPSQRPSIGLTGARPVPPRHLAHPEANPVGRRLAVLTLTALGVVYGDIGTSPLYAMKECFKPEYGLLPIVANVYGVLSLIVWSLIAIVSVKYIMYIMRADNRGEGGILALLALILQRSHRTDEKSRRGWLIALGLFGAALLYGDGVITPAISVLGAVEGLEVAMPSLTPLVPAISVVVIILLFMMQSRGTHAVGRMFGPVMLLWFSTIAALGVAEIALAPQILGAINPWFGLSFLLTHGWHGFVLLGAVVLAVTGAEALYADMGHFGRRPIRLAWFALVFPALLLNYFGQGALLLRDPGADVSPFYLLAPRVLLWPIIALATLAAIIASQALISGAFSLTQQSVQLGYSPRMNIVHTSRHEAGQIYIPEVNKALGIGCVLVVFFFGSSTRLGAAYGIAVTGTMAITSMLFYVVARTRWGWSQWYAGGLVALFLSIDFAFLGANVIKILQGGWVPVALAMGLFILMTSWKRGRELLSSILRAQSIPLEAFLESIEHHPPVRVRGTAVFMTSNPDGAPVVLLHHLKHNKMLHDQVVLLSIMGAEVPETNDEERVMVEPLSQGFFRVRATYGFMETPDVKEILARCVHSGINTRPLETTYYLGHERLIPVKGHRQGMVRMWRWRKHLFAFMSRNALSATAFFGIPPNRAVEMGAQIEF